MLTSLTPSGVEHLSQIPAPDWVQQMLTSLTPSGVEHAKSSVANGVGA